MIEHHPTTAFLPIFPLKCFEGRCKEPLNAFEKGVALTIQVDVAYTHIVEIKAIPFVSGGKHVEVLHHLGVLIRLFFFCVFLHLIVL